MLNRYESWGRTQESSHDVISPLWRSDLSSLTPSGCWLPFGNGRSYGDVCLNDGGGLVDTSHLRHFIDFDLETGLLRCESGVLLDEILRLFIPQGWTLPVVPGTRFITVGGAIANDVHGKNHKLRGTFGCHVRQIELARSDGTTRRCSAEINSDLYAASIGGLGLTGLITWAEIQLTPVKSAFLDLETIPFSNLREFEELNRSSTSHEHRFAWVDCLASGPHLGRGVYYRGKESTYPNLAAKTSPGLSIPFELPFPLVNSFSVSLFNKLYYHRYFGRKWFNRVHYEKFFFPLDSIKHWNRIYGPRGFFQFQCVVPFDGGIDVLESMLDRISQAKLGSFLVVLKTFEDIKSPGMLSFPRPGYTFALDFVNTGDPVKELLGELQRLTIGIDGAIYPAKDACMSSDAFLKAYPQWQTFQSLRDPAFRSSFTERIRCGLR